MTPTRLLPLILAFLIPLFPGRPASGNEVIVPEGAAWISLPEAVAPNARAAVLRGPLDSPGVSYVLRVEIAPGGHIAPHRHPDTRTVTVISGVLLAGRGRGVSDTNATRYPAGSFFEVPAGVIHWARPAGDRVVYQESGMGPTANDFAIDTEEASPPPARTFSLPTLGPDAPTGSAFGVMNREIRFTETDGPVPSLGRTAPLAAGSASVLVLPREWVGAWAGSGERQLALVLAGEIEIETAAGETRRFVPGVPLVVNDMTGHRARVLGPNEAWVVVVPLPGKAGR